MMIRKVGIRMECYRNVNDMDVFLNILLGVFCAVVFFVILTLVTMVIRCIFCTGYIFLPPTF